MNTVAIVDYGMCNLDSVRRAVEECGGRAIVTDDADELDRADRIVLPGVGAFPTAMAHLRDRGLDKVLADQVLDQRVPFLGICLGMQLLADEGLEIEPTPGLGWLPSTVDRLVPTSATERIPHIGWNEVRPVTGCPLFEGIEPGTDFYFVHSFHVVCADPANEAASTPYCGGFTSAVWQGGDSTVFGLQFHPEKSQRAGFAVLRNFLAI